MIDVIVYFLLLMAGLFVGIQLVAAGYGIVDYQYKMDRYIRRVLLTILSWCAVTWLLFALLSEAMQIPLLQGIKVVVLLHIVGVLLSLVVTKRFQRSEESGNRKYLASLDTA